MALTRRERVGRRLAAILAADVVGYSRLMGEDEEGTLAALKAVRQQLIDPMIDEHRGRIVKTMGDGLLVEFASVVDAVLCAVEIQREMTARNQEVSADRRIVFRIGINLGDVMIDEDDIFGDGVNVAARLEGLAEPGGICLSQVVRDQVHGKLDITFVDQGDRQVKNIARPVRVFRVRLSGDAPATPPDEPTPVDLPLTKSPTSDYDEAQFRFSRPTPSTFRLFLIAIFVVGFASVLSLAAGAWFKFGPQSYSKQALQVHDPKSGPQSAALGATGGPAPASDNFVAAAALTAQPKIIGAPVLFEKDNVVLSGAANAIIDRQAEFLRGHPTVTVTVEGYCSGDEGAREGPSVLAQLRANQVRNALKERGVAAARIHTATYEEANPAIADNHEANQAQNRRAVVIRD